MLIGPPHREPVETANFPTNRLSSEFPSAPIELMTLQPNDKPLFNKESTATCAICSLAPQLAGYIDDRQRTDVTFEEDFHPHKGYYSR